MQSGFETRFTVLNRPYEMSHFSIPEQGNIIQKEQKN